MGGEQRITLEKVEDEPYQYYAQDNGRPIGLEGNPPEAGEGAGMFTRTFKLYITQEDCTEDGYPRMEVKETNIQIHDGNQLRDRPNQEYEVELEIDLDEIEENPPETPDTDVDLTPHNFDSETERKKYIELERAVREWNISHPTPRGL